MPTTNGHGPKRAILYARVSTDEQAKSGYSLAQQLEALREYTIREGYEVLEEVADPGQSGASLERPGMDHVRDLVAVGGVSVVLAQDRDRFSREPAYTFTCSAGSSSSTGPRSVPSMIGATILRRGTSRTVSSISSPSMRG
jgi:site-specific DNA recombinase